MTDTPELPKLPVMHEPLNLIHPPSLLRMVVDYANAHGLACYEAGRGDAHASALRDAEKHKRMADILFSSMQLVRQYPDFDGHDGEVNLLGDVMDAAMRGEVHSAVQFIAEIHANYEFQRIPAALDDNTKGA